MNKLQLRIDVPNLNEYRISIVEEGIPSRIVCTECGREIEKKRDLMVSMIKSSFNAFDDHHWTVVQTENWARHEEILRVLSARFPEVTLTLSGDFKQLLDVGDDVGYYGPQVKEFRNGKMRVGILTTKVAYLEWS